MNVEDFRALLDVVESVNMNNDEYGSSWGDFQCVRDILTWAGVELTLEGRDVLDRAIESDGRSLSEDLLRIEREIWGQNFAGSRASSLS